MKTALHDILDTAAKLAGWSALLEDNAWFADCPYDADSDEGSQWVEGRELAMTAQGAASWARWMAEERGRVPSRGEIAGLFLIPPGHIDALLDAVQPLIFSVTDADLAGAIQAWAWDREGDASVGLAATALEMSLERIAMLIPPAEDPDAGFFFREGTDRPLAEQTFGFDGE